ncbi:MAG: hypothetical protein GY781_09535 [Gammaproteobacteria bacterium]|nr:hypothetical protein [Gammaproteobacteria bacterium]
MSNINGDYIISDNFRVCVVGGGNAVHALVALFGSRDMSVNVLASYADEAKRMKQGIAEQGYIEAEFASHNDPAGTVIGKPLKISAQAVDVIPDSDVLILPLPSFTYRNVLEEIKPYLRKGMYIGVSPGQGGFDWVAREVLGDLIDDLVVFSIMPMPFNCRVTEYGKRVEVQEFKTHYQVGVLPTSATVKVISLTEKLFGSSKSCGHFLGSTLYPINAVIHPSRLYTLCKDWQPGKVIPENPLFYEEMTEDATQLMDKVNQELIQIANGLIIDTKSDITVPHIFDFLVRYVYADDSPDLVSFFQTNPAYKGFRCPFKAIEEGWEPDFSNRYFTEDIPLGLCIYKGVADLVDVATPLIDEIIYWAQGYMGKEYIINGRLQGQDVNETHAPQRFGIISKEDLIGNYIA